MDGQLPFKELSGLVKRSSGGKTRDNPEPIRIRYMGSQYPLREYSAFVGDMGYDTEEPEDRYELERELKPVKSWKVVGGLGRSVTIRQPTPSEYDELNFPEFPTACALDSKKTIMVPPIESYDPGVLEEYQSEMEGELPPRGALLLHELGHCRPGAGRASVEGKREEYLGDVPYWVEESRASDWALRRARTGLTRSNLRRDRAERLKELGYSSSKVGGKSYQEAKVISPRRVSSSKIRGPVYVITERGSKIYEKSGGMMGRLSGPLSSFMASGFMTVREAESGISRKDLEELVSKGWVTRM